MANFFLQIRLMKPVHQPEDACAAGRSQDVSAALYGPALAVQDLQGEMIVQERGGVKSQYLTDLFLMHSVYSRKWLKFTFDFE
jgi:hypothetical protein